MRLELSRPGRTWGYVGLVAISLVALVPFLYMVSLSLQSDGETLSGTPVLIPEVLNVDNYVRMWEAAPFGRFFLNSLVVAITITACHLLFDSVAGYAFAKYRFRGRGLMLTAVLGTLMIPFFVRMIPLYVEFANLGLLNSYAGLVLPFVMDGFGIFLMRQFIAPLPDELIEAARLDGASELRIFFRIILPQTTPALAALGVFTFVFQWNEFLWPLVAISEPDMRTLPLGLTVFTREFFTQWNLTAAASVLMFVPTVILFMVAQRYFVRGIALSGLK
ncbi:binding-protein-dependent transport systems inner membrane component [Beutenbergia cavernae DSM 12333]|uniref:Binding-protein-dependent transport systems inner membrane component n=1 Tax=Beutenbergia cavernae (strain ATCC BAA-8 / DSM 12333 / CCUG 43141 / JCM 11478 / NBRC 16432 / NCIMB 13614 / HKI 0122) TaxID=471853 RepID=C5BXG3_BEUC1|nr:carbohydrate ABC transporter permease [Beutenbergia cavernae]ACQ80846.1 binding-protein-dependent transport systems inner membrane component [Beutenbergia cavernae DSM 12333]